jgi:hypothetical protein
MCVGADDPFILGLEGPRERFPEVSLTVSLTGDVYFW